MDSVAGVVRRRWWVLLLPLVLVTALVVALGSVRQGRYEAVATVRGQGSASELRADALVRFADPAFLEEVRRAAAPGVELRTLAARLTVEQDGAHLVRVSYTAAEAAEAQAVAGTAADLLLRIRRAEVDAAGEGTIAAATGRVTDLETAVDEARSELARFERQHPATAPGGPPLTRTVQAEGAALEAEVTRLQDALGAARVAVREAELQAEEASRAVRAEQMIARPFEPADDAWPLWVLAVPVVAAGLAVGAALALAVERRDHTVRDELDVQDATPGIPILAVVDA